MSFRVCIIGCGNIFPMHAQSILNTKGVSLAAVCDIKKPRAKTAAERYSCRPYLDYREMLDKEKPDAVHVLTPHCLHAEMTIAAAKRKIHVLCEKPIAINPKDADRMLAVCGKNKVKLGVISQNRYNPGSQLVKKNIASGSLGKIKAAKIILSYHKPDSYYKKSDWKGTWDKEGGGVLIDQSIHFIDILRWIINDKVEYIEANIASRMHKYIDVEDMAEGVVKFKKGTYICFYFINYYSYDDDTEIELDCEKGRVNIVKDSAKIGFYGGKVVKAQPKAGEYIDYGDGVKDYWGFCHCIQIREFYKALRSGREPEVNGVEARKTLNIVWNIYRSAKLGRKIYLG
ncbi:MAG: Gfo/Idh/MocA family oxidoreductase [Candidatus Omnitrophica bacterium]|nr:Gfo/Idh/MocA family oxidoreductase [Candidatus Omnitrophota bacterium]